MQNLMSRFIKDESGATAIEYGLIAALIGVAIVVGGKALGDALDAKFNEVAGQISGTELNVGEAGD